MSTHKLNKAASGGHYVLIGPYDAELVAFLKSNVPASHREWRGVAKCWRIHEPYDQVVRDRIEGRR